MCIGYGQNVHLRTMTDVENTHLTDTRSRQPWLARSTIVAAGLGLWFFTQSLIGLRPADSRDNLVGVRLSQGDSLFTLTEPINKYLHIHPSLADLLLVASSAVIDGWVFG
jgi:hypothetical protein